MGARHVLVRLRGLCRRRIVQDEIREEFEFHIEQRTADNIRRGLSPGDARLAAQRTFGRRSHLMEAAYEVRGAGAWPETVLFDLRYAFRRLRQSPGFTIPAALILVFGIGANTALFSVLNAALLSRLPVPAAADIVRVYSGRSVAFPTYLALAEAAAGKLELAAYARRPLSIRFGDGYAERVAGEVVTDNYFAMLRLLPIGGGVWSPHSAGTVIPVLLSENYVRQMSAATNLGTRSASGLTGSELWINGEPGVVVGIVPATFTGADPGFRTSAWIPIQSLPSVRSRLSNDSDRWLTMIGRLAAGGSAAQVQARLAAVRPPRRQAREDALRVEPAAGLAVSPDSRIPFMASLGALSAVMAVVLLVASASVGGLLLARAMAARTETALRLALGASRVRVAQQILCETLLLALLAGIASLLVGMGIVPALATLVPADYGLPVLEMRVTGLAALYTIAIACVAGVLFGILPARRLWTADVRAQLRDLAGSTPKRGRASTVLVVAQVAGSVMLVMTAGMFLYALHAATSRTSPVADRILVVPLALHENGYNDARASQFAREVTARLLADPAVRTVSLAQFGLYSGSSNVRLVATAAQPPFEVESNSVGPGYFRTMHLSVVAGREFAADDVQSASPPVIVNAALAQRLAMSLPDAIGRPLRISANGPVPRIVGVVENAENVRPGEGDRPFLYELLPSAGDTDVALHVEAASDGNGVAPMVRNVLKELDPNLPLYRMRTLAEQMRVAMAPSKAAAAMTSALGAVALLLAAAGVYGITAFLVAARTREIGIRLALGANRGDILKLVSRDGVRVTLAGVGAGLVLAVAAARLLDLYFGIAAAAGTVPIAGTTAAVVSGSVALAIWAPLRRSLATDPVRALRTE
jgi:putative ABC transport system permease protein